MLAHRMSTASGPIDVFTKRQLERKRCLACIWRNDVFLNTALQSKTDPFTESECPCLLERLSVVTTNIPSWPTISP